jgi:hypothetical protein
MIDLCEQNKSSRYVAEVLRMSLRDIRIILKKRDLLKQDKKTTDIRNGYVSFTFLNVVAQKDGDVIF